ncbi:MAG: hypothetical protein B6I34_05885 [Anaerolineaceae bacterium 4572_32.1]|nr:MAG: hypothetical protein B6I34_05885 [Anaerolineaceae bacterium 4572_32.1]
MDAYQLLIVEDEPNTSTMLQEFFSQQGYKVRTADRGEEAIAQCQQSLPDLILLNVQLPDMSGHEVYSRIQQQPDAEHTAVIFVTTDQGRDDKLTGLQLGAVDYMTKPLDMEELQLRVRNTLQQFKQSPRR